MQCIHSSYLSLTPPPPWPLSVGDEDALWQYALHRCRGQPLIHRVLQAPRRRRPVQGGGLASVPFRQGQYPQDGGTRGRVSWPLPPTRLEYTTRRRRKMGRRRRKVSSWQESHQRHGRWVWVACRFLKLVWSCASYIYTCIQDTILRNRVWRVEAMHDWHHTYAWGVVIMVTSSRAVWRFSQTPVCMALLEDSAGFPLCLSEGQLTFTVV